MYIELKPAMQEDIETVWKMQVEAFSELLEKYQDYDTSPAAEEIDKVTARFKQPWTNYFFIMANDEKVGVIRVIDKKDGSRKRISPIWIMKEYRNKGYAQKAIEEAERLYGKDHWCLDTILQEKSAEKPMFKECAKHPHIDEKGYVLYYTNQCPFNAKYVPVLEETAKSNGIPFRTVKIDSRKDAQNAPTPITTYALFCDGEYVTNEQMNDKKFLKLVGK